MHPTVNTSTAPLSKTDSAMRRKNWFGLNIWNAILRSILLNGTGSRRKQVIALTWWTQRGIRSLYHRVIKKLNLSSNPNLLCHKLISWISRQWLRISSNNRNIKLVCKLWLTQLILTIQLPAKMSTRNQSLTTTFNSSKPWLNNNNHTFKPC